ncbi:MAG: PHP domain-containing protein [Phycisphaerales bacterium]|nr:PHP domain-containing protein [Phycisphaerales bacterium]
MSHVDLHCHSTASDGTFSPADVVRLAKKNKLSGLALTDHDTTNGLAEASAEAAQLGIDFVTGIEISAVFPYPGRMHLLGYGIDPASADLRAIISQLLEGRDDRNPRIIAKLQSLNVAISMEEVEAQARIGTSDQTGGHKPIGRPHIAAVLLKKGYVSSIKQAFDKYLAPGGLAYVDKERVSRQQIIDAIHRSGGVCVLAHPFQLHTADEVQLEKVIKEMVDLGLDGIEVLHSDHDQSWIDQCTRLADKFGLLKTGGSDFHGSNKKEIALGLAGGRTIPRQWFDALRLRISEQQGALERDGSK